MIIKAYLDKASELPHLLALAAGRGWEGNEKAGTRLPTRDGGAMPICA